MEDISEKKLELIERNVDKLPGYIERLSKKRPDQYEFKEAEWKIKCNKIRNILNEKSYFLFIGRFSSGKSSFINALMGRDILPTNSKPTTAVVTEVIFKEEGITNGIVYYKDDRFEQKSKAEILEIIKGKTKINVGSVHHVCLSISINDKEFESCKEAFMSLVDKVVLVDSPGFDSPYKFSEDVLYEYVEKSSFTYYFLPADDFGNISETRRLRNIRKHTATLIPVISKSDTINDSDDKNVIIESFEKQFADIFPDKKEPIFVSTFKFKEYQAKLKEWEDKIESDSLTDEENRVLRELEYQAGVEHVSGEMASDAKQSALNQKKIDSVKFEFDTIIEQILDSVRKEENYWQNELKKINYDFESQEYKDLERANKQIGNWINDQAKEVSKSLKDIIVIEVTNHYNETSGHPNVDIIKNIYNESFGKILNDNKSKWIKKFEEYFKDVSADFNGNVTIEPPKIDFGLPGGVLIDTVSGGAKAEPVLLAAGGATLLGTHSLIASLTIDAVVTTISIGAILAPIASFAGIALLGVAVVKGYAPMKKAYKEAKENREKEIQRKVDGLLSKNTNFEAVISKFLNDHREKVYSSAINSRNSDKATKFANYEDCQDLRKTLETLGTNLNDKIQ
ncbi:MAG: dynamin family protein [Bacteroidales bacterium]|nr:dynamin family protein [Bacteroidales bacterium]